MFHSQPHTIIHEQCDKNNNPRVHTPRLFPRKMLFINSLFFSLLC
jgi:hypothetical protein